MNLETLPAHIIRDFIQHCYTTKQYSILIVLKNGDSMCGILENRASDSEPPSETAFTLDSYLALVYGGTNNEHTVFVPFDKIAGIHKLPYSQEKNRPGSHYFDEGSAHERLFQDLIAKAHLHGFQIVRHAFSYNLDFEKPFDWSNIRFSESTPLYADWDYLQRISGGLNNIGIGVPIGSISAGWSESLWQSFSRKIDLRRSSFDDVCSNHEVSLEGYASIIKQVTSAEGFGRLSSNLEMEGAEWVATALSNQRVLSSRRLKSVKWALLYFKTSGFMFPLDLWDKISQPIRIFGEVVPVNVGTEAGNLGCFLKCRAAAFVSSELGGRS